MHNPPAKRIPNVFHFIFGLKPQVEPFHLMHYLCLESCRAVNRPERICVHLYNEPWGELWDLIRPKIEVIPIPESDLKLDLRYEDKFIEKFSYAHIADFIRIRALYEHGGIYADMDTLFIAPIPRDLLDESCVMGHERVDWNAPSAPKGSLCNALIMAEPGSAFIGHWIERMPAAFDGSWANHACFLPYRLALEFPDLIRVEPESRFFSQDWTREGIAGLFAQDCPMPADAVSLHLWAHLWWDFARRDFSDFSARQLTPAYVAHAHTTYARLARPHLPPGLAPSAATYARETRRLRRALRLQHLRARLRSELLSPLLSPFRKRWM